MMPKEHIDSIISCDEKPTKRGFSLLVALPFVWTFSIFLIIATSLLVISPARESTNKYSIYSSKPLVLGISTNAIGLGDSRAAKINEIFKDFRCPRADLGDKFVSEADKNGIPFWIVAAISFQESSCGKMTPEPDGVESHNWWGWGVWADNVKGFDNPEHGIEVVSKYLNERFFAQGITEPCDIMKVYTPPSKGSWCNGVNYFGEMIQEYQTPIKL